MVIKKCHLPCFHKPLFLDFFTLVHQLPSDRQLRRIEIVFAWWWSINILNSHYKVITNSMQPLVGQILTNKKGLAHCGVNKMATYEIKTVIQLV